MEGKCHQIGARRDSKTSCMGACCIVGAHRTAGGPTRHRQYHMWWLWAPPLPFSTSQEDIPKPSIPNRLTPWKVMPMCMLVNPARAVVVPSSACYEETQGGVDPAMASKKQAPLAKQAGTTSDQRLLVSSTTPSLPILACFRCS